MYILISHTDIHRPITKLAYNRISYNKLPHSVDITMYTLWLIYSLSWKYITIYSIKALSTFCIIVARTNSNLCGECTILSAHSVSLWHCSLLVYKDLCNNDLCLCLDHGSGDVVAGAAVAS